MSNINLIIIDNSIHNYQTIIGAVQTNTRYILLDSPTDTYDTLKTKISELNVVSFQSVGVIQHNMGGATYSLFRNADASTASALANVIQIDPNLDTWADYVNFITYLKTEYSMENFDLMACALYSDPNWKYVIDTLETRTGVNIRASKDNTGSAELGGNWFLETDSVNLKNVYFTDLIDGFRGILLNGYHTIVLATNGIIYSSGSNGNGQLGDGGYSSRSVFGSMLNNTGKTVKSIFNGYLHSIVIMTDGTIYATGYNWQGQLGNGTDGTGQDRSSLTLMTNNTGKIPISVACGNYFTLVHMTDGTIYGTGYNYHGQLGDITTNTKNTLTLMNNNTGKILRSVVAGGYHTIVLMTDGTIYGTGYNSYGQLGDGTTNNRGALTLMTNNTGKTPKSVACGTEFTIVLMTDGTIYGTGYNDYGQLGDGTTTNRSYLTLMTNNTGKTPSNIICGSSFTIVLMTDRTIYGTGHNSYGQLGDATSVSRSALTLMTNNTGKTPKSVDCGFDHTVLLMTDGSVYGTGANGSGQLGLADTLNRNVITQMISSGISKLANQQEYMSFSYTTIPSGPRTLLNYITSFGINGSSSYDGSSPLWNNGFDSLTLTHYETINNYFTRQNRVKIIQGDGTGDLSDWVIFNFDVDNGGSDFDGGSTTYAYFGGENTYAGGTGGLGSGLYGIIWGWGNNQWNKLFQMDLPGSGYNHSFAGWWSLGNTVALGNGKYTAYDALSITHIGFSVQYEPSVVPSVMLSTPPTLSWSAITRNFGDSAFTITAPTSNSSGSFSYTSSNTGVATISGTTVTIVGAGSTTITATQAASGNYSSGSITTTLTVNPIAPSLSNFTVASRNFGTGSFTLTAPTSNSNGAFTYNSDTTAVATISGTTVTIVGVGNSLITAIQAATTNYLQGSINAVFTVNPIAPTFYTFSAITKTFGDSPFTISASSNSSGSISYTSSNTAVATISISSVSDIYNSTIVTLSSARTAIHNLIGQNIKLLYQSTRENYANSAFRTACDNQGPTLTVVKASNGAIALAYSSISFTSINSYVSALSGSCWLCPFQTSDSASPNTTLYYNTVYPSTSLYNGTGYGPTFGNGHDLYINVNGSYTSPNAYQSPPNGLFNHGTGYQSFTLSSIEVYGLGTSSVITIVGAGSTTITANQAASGNYTSGSIDTNLTVNPGAPSLSGFNSLTKNFGDLSFSLIPPTTNSSGIFEYISSNTSVATITSIRNALNFDGGNDAIDLGIPTWSYSTQFRTTMTVECWFRTTDTNNLKTYPTLVSRNITGSVSSTSQFSLYLLPTGEVGFGITNNSNNGFYHTTSLSYKDTKWHHVAATYNSSTGTKIIYIDGIAVRTDTNAGLGLLSNNNSVKLIIGSDEYQISNNGSDRQFRGSIADVRIWNVVRTPSEIFNNFQNQLNGNETGLVLYNKLDQGTVGIDNGPTTLAKNNMILGGNSGTLVNFSLSGSTSNWVYGPGPQFRINIIGVGSTTITANQASSANYTSGSIDTTLTVNSISPTLSGFNPINKNIGDSAFQLRPPSTNSSGIITYTSSNTSVATITSVQRNALNFDGINDHIDFGIPDWSYSTAFRTTMSVELWFRTTDINYQKYYCTLISRNATGNISALSQFTIYLTEIGQIGFGLTNNNDTGFYNITSSTYIDTQWHHVAATYDSSTGIKIIYVDGIAVRTDTKANFGLLSNNNTIRVVVGGDHADLSDRRFRGSIADVRIWNVVRTPTEIFNNYQIQLNGNETGLVLYNKLDQGTANGSNTGINTATNNLLSGGNTGTLYNFSLSSSTSNWVIGPPLKFRINIVSVGTTTITANQASTNNYNAGSISTTLTIANPITPTINWSNISKNKLGGFALSGALAPTSNSSINYDTTWNKLSADIFGEAAGDMSGSSVSLSADGTVVAIGAPKNNGANGRDSGSVRVYALSGGVWSKRGADIDGDTGLSSLPMVVSATLDSGSRAWRRISISSTGQYQTAIMSFGIFISSNYGVVWSSVPTANGIPSDVFFNGISVSSNGQYQTAVSGNNYIYISSNYGNNWTTKDSSRNWYDISVSSTGQYQTAVVYNGQIYISSDYGNNWAAKENNRAWNRVSISSTGQYQTIVVYNGQIYISSDYGNNWIAKDSSRSWEGVDISSTGQYQTAYNYNGQIYISSDFGYTWTAKEGNRAWYGISLSSTGQFQTASVNGGQIYISSDFGNNWISRENNRVWYGISISSTGQYQSAVVNNGYIHFSRDYGLTWSTTASYEITEGDQFGTSVSLSASGNSLAIGAPYFDSSSIINRGQVRVYDWNGSAWSARGSNIIIGEESNDYSGMSVSMSADGNVVAIGAPFNDGANGTNSGQVCVYAWNGSAWSQRGADIDGKYGLTATNRVVSATGTIIGIWYGVSLSSSGQYQTAVIQYTGNIWTSDNYGISWTERIPGGSAKQWWSVSISSTGQYQTAVVLGGNIWTSYDFGVTWVSRATVLNWYSVSVSSTGQYQSAVVQNGNIWTSSDFGVSWVSRATVLNWYSVSLSSNGQYQTAVAYSSGGVPGTIHTSSDFGQTWNKQKEGTFGQPSWISVSLSSTGQYQTAVVPNSNIWTSYDFGVNWIERTLSPVETRLWNSVSISGSGQYQCALASNKNIWTSSDFGVNWIERTTSGARDWKSVSVSSTGQYQTAVVWSHGIAGIISFSRDYGNTWSTTASYEITEGDQFGTSVSLSADGNNLAVGAPLSDNGYVIDCGLVRIYNWNGSNWVQLGSDIYGEATNDMSGKSVSLSADGTIVAIGSPNNNGANGIGSGSVRVYNWNGSAWNKRGADIDGEAGSLTPIKVMTATDINLTGTAWDTISLSSTGQYQTAVKQRSYIWTSNNYGLSWTERIVGSTTRMWQSVSLSSTGQYQTAVGNGNNVNSNPPHYLFVSTDYGVSWAIRITSNTEWISVSLSSSGQYQTAASFYGNIYLSSNYGSNWTEKIIGGSTRQWWSVSISSTGQYQTAVVLNGNIWFSSDFGDTWTERTIGGGTKPWYCVSLSSNGQYQTAVFQNGHIWTSSNFGVSWTERNTGALRNWTYVSLSSTGQYQTAGIGNGVLDKLWTSSDFGETWISRIGDFNWMSVSVSSSGQYQAAAGYDNSYSLGNIQFSRDYGNTWSEYASYEVFDGDQSGVSVSLSANGNAVAIGAPYNDGSFGVDKGHVRVYDWDGSSNWVKRAVDIDGETNGDFSGHSISLSSDGTVVAVGSPFNSKSSINSGSVSLYNIGSYGKFTYTSSNTAVADVYGSIVIVKAEGTTTLTATQSSSFGYLSGSVSTTLNVLFPSFYTFTGHTFTNASATGRTGPTLSAIRNAYTGTTWAQDTTNNYLNMTTQGIQLWTVPQTGSYTFRAIGAGSEYANANGGQGVDISTTVNLTQGEVIKIIVGQKGSANNSGGGGGATYVVKNDGTTIIVAGGGGGAFNSSTFINSIPQSNATTNTSGNNSFFNQ